MKLRLCYHKHAHQGNNSTRDKKLFLVQKTKSNNYGNSAQKIVAIDSYFSPFRDNPHGVGVHCRKNCCGHTTMGTLVIQLDANTSHDILQIRPFIRRQSLTRQPRNEF